MSRNFHLSLNMAVGSICLVQNVLSVFLISPLKFLRFCKFYEFCTKVKKKKKKKKRKKKLRTLINNKKDMFKFLTLMFKLYFKNIYDQNYFV